MDLKITPSGQTIVKPTALGPGANTDTKLLIYGLFQKGRVLAQDGEEIGSLRWHFRWFRPSGLSTRWRCCELPASGRVRLRPEPETHRK